MYIRNVDIVLSEGYKKNPLPKIEVSRLELNRKLLCGRDDNLIAVVSDYPLDIGVDCLGINDIKGVVDVIEERFLKS